MDMLFEVRAPLAICRLSNQHAGPPKCQSMADSAVVSFFHKICHPFEMKALATNGLRVWTRIMDGLVRTLYKRF